MADQLGASTSISVAGKGEAGLMSDSGGGGQRLNNGGDHNHLADNDGGGGGGKCSSNDVMSMSMTAAAAAADDDLEDPSGGRKRSASKRNEASDNWFTHEDEGSDRLSATSRDREDRVRRIREQQEDERRKKLEELKEHALSAQKYREQQEGERRAHLQEMRSRDADKLTAVFERRKAIETATLERKEALLKRAQEREGRIIEERRRRESRTTFAFGSSTPRTLHPNVHGSNTDIWSAADRSPSSSSTAPQGSHLMTQSMYAPSMGLRRSAERETHPSESAAGPRARSTSTQALDRAGAGDGNDGTDAFAASAHRRRTDLMPTAPLSAGHRSQHPPRRPHRSTAGRRAVSTSRLDLLATPRSTLLHAASASKSSSPSTHNAKSPQSPVTIPSNELRKNKDSRARMSLSLSHLNKDSTTPRPSMAAPKPSRPVARRATTVGAGVAFEKPSRQRRAPPAARSSGMSREGSLASASRPTSVMSTDSSGVKLRSGAAAAVAQRQHRARPVSIATSGVMSTSMFEQRTPPHNRTRTSHKPLPSSEGRAKRPGSSEKDDDAKSVSSVKSSTNSTSNTAARRTPAQVKAEAAARKAKASPSKSTPPPPPIKSPSSAKAKPVKSANHESSSSSSPSSSNSQKEPSPPRTPTREKSPSASAADSGGEEAVSSMGKKIITSEEEAKARMAEKRREMKEKMEREAEAERQKQLEAERLEEERRRIEEEEEKRALEEADRMAEEARVAEEARLQKAIEEAKKNEEVEKIKREEEERLKKEKEETDMKAREEAEQKQKELEEKLKKEEEERSARKKRIEEIMARTRGGGGGGKGGATTPTSTPKKETPEPDATSQESASISNNNNKNHSSSNEDVQMTTATSEDEAAAAADGAGEMKPDLIGDLTNLKNEKNVSDVADVKAETAPDSPPEKERAPLRRPFAAGSSADDNGPVSSCVEKGELDVQMKEQTDNENGGDQLLSLSEFDELRVTKQPNTSLAAAGSTSANVELDQILDLNHVAETSGDSTAAGDSVNVIDGPIIAFEDSITSPRPEPPVADLLS